MCREAAYPQMHFSDQRADVRSGDLDAKTTFFLRSFPPMTSSK
jgi:hypothetical protein